MQGREAVPDTVDHVLVEVDPKADRSWLQTFPEVLTDNIHAFDRTGPAVDTPENWSEALKRLKPRVLQRLIDAYKCAAGSFQTLILILLQNDLDCSFEHVGHKQAGALFCWHGFPGSRQLVGQVLVNPAATVALLLPAIFF